MKKFALAAALMLAASTAFAGGLAQPIVEPAPAVAVVATNNSSSGSGIVVPLLLILVIAAVAASK